MRSSEYEEWWDRYWDEVADYTDEELAEEEERLVRFGDPPDEVERSAKLDAVRTEIEQRMEDRNYEP